MEEKLKEAYDIKMVRSGHSDLFAPLWTQVMLLALLLPSQVPELLYLAVADLSDHFEKQLRFISHVGQL